MITNDDDEKVTDNLKKDSGKNANDKYATKQENTIGNKTGYMAFLKNKLMLSPAIFFPK